MKRIIALLLLTPLAAGAQDFFAEVSTEADDEPVAADSPFRYRGWIGQKTGYGWRAPALPAARDTAALTRSQTRAFGEVSWRSGPWRAQVSGSLVHDWLPDLERGGLWSAYQFTDEQVAARRWQLEMSDTYISWQKNDWWLKAGLQTLAWGEAESLKVTDVLARRDQRWPGQDDLENLRLPVGALRITWRNQIDLVTLIEPLPDRLPAAYEEFDPYIGVRSVAGRDVALVEKPDHDPGVALRWRGRWQGVDAQLMLADVASYELAPRQLDGDRLTLAPWRNQVAGLAVQAAQGSVLLRSEQAWHHGTKVARRERLAPWQDTDQWRGMLGADYSGVEDLTLTGEISWIYIDNWSPALDADRWQTGAAARASYTLYNERLALEAYGQRLSGGEGTVARLSAQWTFSDTFSAKLTAIDYGASDESDTLYPYRRNDTLLLDLRWGL